MKAYPAYKDSGVEWLGEIPARWGIVGLTKYLESIVDYRGKTPEKVESGTFLVTARNIKNGKINYELSQEYVRSDEYEQIMQRGLPKKGDVLFTTEAPLGEAANVDKEGIALAQRIIKFRGKKEYLNNYFLKYWILSHAFQNDLHQYATGSTALGIKASKLNFLRLVLPPLSEQRAIAAFLDHKTRLIDTYVAKKQQQIERLQVYRTALINQAVTKGLNPDAPMKDSGIEWLGEIPVSWDIVRLKYLVENMTAGPFGSSLTKDMYTKDGYRVYGQEQVIPADFTIGDYYISKEMYQEMNRYAVAPGDVLVSCVGTFGKIAVVPEDIEPGIINPRLIKLTLLKQQIIPNYLNILLSDRVAFNQLERVSRGGTMGVINIGLLSELLLPVPQIKEQQTIIDFINRETTKIDTLIAKTQHQIDRLQAYRTALISDAVTGKIDVRTDNYRDYT